MKKAISLLGIVLGFFLISEKTAAQSIKLGVRAGYNSSSWRGESTNILSNYMKNSEIFSKKEKPGFFAGVYTQIPLTPRIVFEPGLYYSQKGVSYTISYPGENILGIRGTVTSHAHYIDLPLQLKAFVTERLYVFGGPQISYLVANKVEGKAGILGFSQGYKIDFDKGFRKFDFALSGGIGYNISDKVNVQVGYEHGLSRVDDFLNAGIYNRVFKAGLGVQF